MAGSARKATKKFEKNHLKDTIERRKDVAKIKQRQQIKVKRQARNVADKARAPELEDSDAKAKNKGTSGAPDISKMSVDEFFQGGFDIPEKTSKKRSRSGEQINKDQETDANAIDNGLELVGSDGDVNEFDIESNDGEFDLMQEDGLGMHKEDLDALAEKDPEFYKYLKENDAELLDFDENGNDAVMDEMSDEEAPKKKRRKNKEDDEDSNLEKSKDLEVTAAMIKKWKTAMADEHSLRAMRQVVLAFRAAAHVNSDDGKSHKYTITNADIYHDLLITALEHVPKVLIHHLPPKEFPSGKVRVPTDSKKFRSLSPLLKSYSASIHQLLESLSDAPTIKMTLNALHPLVPYLLSFGKQLQDLTKIVVSIWSSTTSTSSEATLITAFLLMRRLFVLADSNLRTAILKTVYLSLIKASRTTNTHTLPTINVLKASAAELWGMDSTIGYTTGFTHIRQLAIHLRGTITKPTKDSYKAIYNWQYVHSLDFWAQVLSMHCSPAASPRLKKPDDSPLHPLIYPLVQITLGALRLIPTPAYFPLRFHLTRSLLRISRTTNTYIPVAPSLLEVLNSPDMTKPPKASTLPPLDFLVVLRAPKPYLHTRTYQDSLGEQVHELLAEFFSCWARNIAFPELIVPPTVALKRWLKKTTLTTTTTTSSSKTSKHKNNHKNRGSKTHTHLTLLLQKLSAHANFIASRRANVTFAPGNRVEVDRFQRGEGFEGEEGEEETPLGLYVKGLRVGRERREKVLAAAAAAANAEKDKDRGRDKGMEEEEDEEGE